MNHRIAFVTGASQGIGRACAHELARAGARVFAAARQQDKLAALVDEIRAEGGQCDAVALDVTSRESIDEAFGKVKTAGTVSILVNNAGVTQDGLAVRMTAEHWRKVLDTNLTGGFVCIQKVLPGMMKQRWGRIINVTSVVGLSGNAGQANYVSSKAGLIGLTKALALEVASRNITVNAVAPGFIETPMTDVLSEKVREQTMQRIPLRRLGRPAEIAKAVGFLAGDDAAYITGHVLNVNGGMYM
ncbi:MAG: 3-oxoacyl-[acyl-carrier-protein] reductase [Bryobacterales bacterium]|nr:3-oxoacyl-[acyl-carrier-protein] reductase [Bryobacterales bacterium]MDE0294570.1 3-oxoacyl-[acyl-carrier-protein] reductase [Bryobacterales bacterium]MDE0434401.1 3-oxoacyl-[acyl-carrier-protein] reductase [Bryobacterales bacterium]